MSFTMHHARPYAARVAAYGFFVVLSVVFTMATALSVADFVKILFPTSEVAPAVPTGSSPLSDALQGLYEWLIAFGPKHALIYFSLLLLGLYACKNIFGYLSLVQISIVRARIVRDLRSRMFNKVLALPLAYFGTHRRGDVLARFAGDITEYDQSTLGSLQGLLSAVVSLVLYLAMLFYISVRLTLFVLLMLPVVALVISGISHRLRRESAVLQQRYSFLMSLMEETIVGLKVIKAYTAIGFSNRRFQQASQGHARLRTKVFRRVDLASPVSDFAGNCVVIGILLFGSSLVIGGNKGITPDLFVSYIMMFVLMIPPAKELTTAVSQIKKGKACTERIAQFLALPEEQADEPGARDFTGLREGIEFRDIHFAYTPQCEVLSDINLTIPRGATVALVGSSGSGKSTLADLLMRFHRPTSGEILIDGQPAHTFRTATLRQHIGVVDQHTFLFNASVRHNIAYGTPSASQQQVVEAARVAGAHDFIVQLPEGYDTPIGDSGALLSGGQRQRISIARAVLLQPDLLILDEATSALDTESEALVRQSLQNLLVGRTALIIAHRLSTVAAAQLIVVLEGGRIVERGTHQELLQLGGRYSQLVKNSTLLN